MKSITKHQFATSLIALFMLLVLSTDTFAQTRRRQNNNCQPNTVTNYNNSYQDRDRDYRNDRNNRNDRNSRDNRRYDNRDYRDYDYDDRDYRENRPSRTKHLIVGSALGAVGGAVIGGKKGALIGAGAGAGVGYIIYRNKDRR